MLLISKGLFFIGGKKTGFLEVPHRRSHTVVLHRSTCDQDRSRCRSLAESPAQGLSTADSEAADGQRRRVHRSAVQQTETVQGQPLLKLNRIDRHRRCSSQKRHLDSQYFQIMRLAEIGT